jgi:hypothetical protein
MDRWDSFWLYQLVCRSASWWHSGELHALNQLGRNVGRLLLQLHGSLCLQSVTDIYVSCINAFINVYYRNEKMPWRCVPERCVPKRKVSDVISLWTMRPLDDMPLDFAFLWSTRSLDDVSLGRRVSLVDVSFGRCVPWLGRSCKLKWYLFLSKNSFAGGYMLVWRLCKPFLTIVIHFKLKNLLYKLVIIILY